MRSRRQTLRRRRWVAATVATVVVISGSYVSLSLLAPLDRAVASVVTVSVPSPEGSSPTFPNYGASAIGALGFDGVLASGGTAAPLPIASISKIVTALVVLDSFPLDIGEDGATIAFGPADVALYDAYRSVGGKVESVHAGLELTQREVLEVMLVSSANNYAESLATWAFGSTTGYVEMAGSWLSEHRLDQTTIVEPTGMSPLNSSSAADLIDIGKLALGNGVVAQIVGTTAADVPSIGAITNSNKLLGIDGIDGIKTGTLDEAGACLLFSADYTVGDTTVTVVGVVLGGVDHQSVAAAVRSLLGGVAAGFHEVPLTTAGEVFASYAADWTHSAAAVAEADRSVLVWSNTPITARVDVPVLAGGASGDPAGSVTFTVGDKRIIVPLVLEGALRDPGPWWRLTHPREILGE